MQVNSVKRTTTNIIASIVLVLIVVFICYFSYKFPTVYKVKKDDEITSFVRNLNIEFNGVKITQIDGKSIDLSKDQTFTLKNGDDYNTICIKNGKIACIEANCKDKVCEKKGFIDGAHDNDIIVCAPHKLVISFNFSP